ncbi:MAG: CehA/McbA family metallohydrolase [Oryzihumus sp.]
MCDHACSDDPDRDPRGLHLHRRGLLAAGAGAVTTAALLDFAPAEAGRTRTQVFTGQFVDPTTPDWHYLPFKVPAGVNQIDVAYTFSPTDTGVGFSYNVVDIGIFDPSGHELGDGEGFRGWSGGARRSFWINDTGATPGYLPGPITPGVWNIALGPYAIVAPGTPYRVTVTLRFGAPGPAFVPHPPPRRVPGTGPGWYRGDMHLHTVYSDGRRTLPQMITAAREAGLDFINSSEHNTTSAHLRWGRFTPQDFLVMTGEEVTTRTGHWLAVGLPAGAWIDWRYRASDGELPTYAARVRSLGGLAIAAHPFNPVPSIRWDFGPDWADLDAVEVWNGPWTGDDQTTVQHWHDLLVAGRFVPAVGNSDSHNESQAVGLAQTVVRSASLASGALVDGIRGGHAWVAESSKVHLTFTATLGARVAECGDRLDAAPTDVVEVLLTARGVPGSLARLLGASGVLGFAVADAWGHVRLSAQVPGSEPFVRAEVGRPDGSNPNPVEGTPIAEMAALTNPVFLAAPAAG